MICGHLWLLLSLSITLASFIQAVASIGTSFPLPLAFHSCVLPPKVTSSW